MHNGEASLSQTDTADWARRRQLELYRAMTPQERLDVALSLSESTRELSLAGLQRLHPDEGDLQLRGRLATFLHGEAVGARLRAALARRAR